MKCILTLLGLATTLCCARPLALHPENPHYFLYQEKPALLITSAEHYGALVNLDFDYIKYLDTLAADGLNLTRVFTGAYIEPPGAFNIAGNTLAPSAGKFLSPWVRTPDGRFDLTKANDAWLSRLQDFVTQAGKRGIIVELTLFCPMYEEPQWKISPMNAINNINGVGAVGPHDVHTLDKNGGLLPIQEALVRRIVAALKNSDNLCYEICNEPYFGGVTMAWQHHIADVIIEAEKDFPDKHLISQNIANGSEKIEKPHPGVSVFQFHYANPPDAVAQNYALNKAIGDNETGFKGTADDHYRMEAWEFILAGGAVFNNLDYSFSAGHEDGSYQYHASQPGGGNKTFRQQIRRLSEFIHQFQFVKMQPARDLIREPLPKDARCQMLAEKDRQYAAYFKNAPDFAFTLELPAATWQGEWLDVVSGKKETITLPHPGGPARLQVPKDQKESALRLVQ